MQTLEPSFVLHFFVVFTVIIVLILVKSGLRSSWRTIPSVIVVVLLVRLFLFDNPWSWLFYKNFLTVDDVGWRQMAVINYEYTKFFKRPQKTKYLAVGSSQTGALYAPYSRKYNEPKIFTLSGLNSLDLILYKKHIKSFKPDYILLYLSEFDLAHEPGLERVVIAPNQGLHLLKIYPILLETMSFTNSKSLLMEILMSEFFPEYKYSFIFRGIINNITKKNKALKTQALTKIPNDEYLKIQLKNLKKNIDKKWVNLHFNALENFLNYCKKQSLNIIIVEGQYNPLAYTDENLALNRIVHKRLLALESQLPNVVFIPRSAVFEFSVNDYRDGFHVKPKQAYYYVEKLMRVIEKNK